MIVSRCKLSLILIFTFSNIILCASNRIARQIDEHDLVKSFLDEKDDDEHSESKNEPFFDPPNENEQLQLSKLLEVKFINDSFRHYHNKVHQIHSSLHNRVHNNIHIHNPIDQLKFSPELMEKFYQTSHKLIDSLELSTVCMESLNYLKVELMQRKLWPLKFIDSVQLLPTGLFEGVLSSLGTYEECLNIQSPKNSFIDIKGKYCLAKVSLSLMNPLYDDHDNHIESNSSESILFTQNYSKKKALFDQLGLNFELLNNKLKMLQMSSMFNGSYYRIGVCFPSACSSREIERVLHKVLEPIKFVLNREKFIEIEKECSVLDQKIKLNIYQRVSLFILAVLSSLVFLSTCFDYYLIKKEAKTKSEYFVFFSALRNTNALFDSYEYEDNRLNIVASVLLMLVLAEFVARSYVLPVFFGMINVKRFQTGLASEYFTSKKFIILRNSMLAAGTYVLLMGVVLTYNLCKNHKKPQNFKITALSYLKFVTLRWTSYIRLLTGPILLIYLLPLIGDGPIWHYFEQLFAQPCKLNLLPSILFYSNYANSYESVCNPPSAILAGMFHLSLLSPLILYIIKKGKNSGYVVFPALLVLGSALTLVPKLYLNLPVAPPEAAHMSSLTQAKKSFLHYHYATNQLVVPFVVGSLVGYLIACKPKLPLGSRFTKMIILAGMQSLLLVTVAWNEQFDPMEGNFTQFNFVSWFVLGRIMWSIAVGSIVYICATGRTEFVSSFFCWPYIRPFAKLSFGVYLNHTTVLAFRQLTKREVTPLNHVEILTDDIGDLVIAFCISFSFYLLIERPFHHLIRLIIGPFEMQLKSKDSHEVDGNDNHVDLENGKIETVNHIIQPLNQTKL